LNPTDPNTQKDAAAGMGVKDFSDLKRILAGMPERDRSILAAAVLINIHHPALALRQKVVVLIHGIRTYGDWQIRFKNILQTRDIEARTINYGRFKLLEFLLPGPTRTTATRRVARELRSLRSQYSDPEIYVFCHSFGTYIISRILDDETDIFVHQLLTCGSIIPRAYRWDKVIDRIGSRRVVNEVGTRDIFPILAKQATWGFGPSGTFGFGSAFVEDRFYPFRHSDFFSDGHMSKFWLPLIQSGYPPVSPDISVNGEIFERRVRLLDFFSWKKWAIPIVVTVWACVAGIYDLARWIMR